MLRKMTVEYLLTGEEIERIDYLTRLFDQATGKKHTAEQTFTALMTIGSARDIRDKMDFAELNFSANIQAIA
jgi:hypothetical protein